MSFVDFLMKYYIWIIVVLIIAIVTVIGFLADARSKKKKMSGSVSGIDGANSNTDSDKSVVAPQPVDGQSIVSQQNEQVGVSDISMPVGELVLNSGIVSEVPVVEPVAPVQEPVGEVPVMPVVEPVVPVQGPVGEVPVMPVVEPVASVQEPVGEVPVMPVVEPVAPVQEPVGVASNSASNLDQSLSGFNSFVNNTNSNV